MTRLLNLRRKSIVIDKNKTQFGGSPAYAAFIADGLLSGKSITSNNPIVKTDTSVVSDHIISTSGGGRRRKSTKRSCANRSCARRSRAKRSSSRRSSSRRSSSRRSSSRLSSSRRNRSRRN